ncbi:hypothetical protein [Conexibacter sp. SYSU D00693]|nr:hypothetical protein [Conexibacter sp. SYSU D00693]
MHLTDLTAAVMAAGVWHDTWKIATSVAVLFFLLWAWNWMMSHFGTF